MSERSYSRRQFLEMMAKVGAGIGAAGALGGLAGCKPATTTTTTTELKGEWWKDRADKLGRPLRMHHDAVLGQAFQPYLDRFVEQYGIKAEGSYVPTDYHAVTETQLMGGADYDVLFADAGYLQKWYAAGWIQDLEWIPGLEELRKDMIEGVEGELKAADGKLVALPYYVGQELFMYNTEMLDAIGAKPPATWAEATEQLRTMKQKGVADYPFVPHWGKEWDMIYGQFHNHTCSEGVESWFDKDGKPTFDTDPVVIDCLKLFKTWYDEELVPPDVMVMDYGSGGNAFKGGKSAYRVRYAPEVKSAANPELSQVVGKVKIALMPGKTHHSRMWSSVWFMAKNTPDRDLAWLLMSYFAAKDKEGVYYFPREWAISRGVGFCWKPLFEDKSILEEWGKWIQLDILQQQQSLGRSIGPIVNELWYAEWKALTAAELQKGVIGEVPVETALKNSADFVRRKRGMA